MRRVLVFFFNFFLSYLHVVVLCLYSYEKFSLSAGLVVVMSQSLVVVCLKAAQKYVLMPHSRMSQILIVVCRKASS